MSPRRRELLGHGIDGRPVYVEPAPRPLGRVQTQVLVAMANATTHGHTVRELSMDWPGLTESSVRSAVESLSRRGLVDCVGFSDAGRLSAREFDLTEAGAVLVEDLADEWAQEGTS